MTERLPGATDTLPLTQVDLEQPGVLVLLDGQFRAHPLPPAGAATLGRGPECTIAIDHASVSRVHATIEMGETSTVSDAGSRNGTLVRGMRVLPNTPTPVHSGEAIQLGAVTVILQGRLSGAAPGHEAAGHRNQTHAARPSSRPRPSAEDPAGAAMRAIAELVLRVAPSNLNILLLGETGVGKGVLAERLHRLSGRAAGPFLGLNCCAFSEPLLASELFGHERGAFTGAMAAKPGLLELASGGTVLLDEIGELPEAIQVKLLRVLEERVVWRVGAIKPRPMDVRFVAATNRDLQADMAVGRFRSDLYFRINGLSLRLPPLRERRDEIATLAEQFLTAVVGPRVKLSPAALAALEGQPWPGNIRELRNVVERAAAVARGPEIQPADLLLEVAPQGQRAMPALPNNESERITAALAECAGNQSRAAELLGISRATLVRRLDELGIRRPRRR